MAEWKRLTLVTNAKVEVNLDAVVMIARAENGAELTFLSGGGLIVNDRPEDIIRP